MKDIPYLYLQLRNIAQDRVYWGHAANVETHMAHSEETRCKLLLTGIRRRLVHGITKLPFLYSHSCHLAQDFHSRDDDLSLSDTHMTEHGTGNAQGTLRERSGNATGNATGNAPEVL